MIAATPPLPVRLITRALPALGALALGLAFFLAVGFASPAAIHDAAHDARHALGYPCH